MFFPLSHRYLHNSNGVDVNPTGAWEDGWTGEGVKIAIVDDGVLLTHPDLLLHSSLELSHDFYDEDANPEPHSVDSHGTAMAGYIAANANDIDIRGVAYESTTAGIRFISPTESDYEAEEFDQVLSRASKHKMSEIDIYCHTWAPEEGFDMFTYMGDQTESSFSKVIQNGRGGKGSIIVFAAGHGMYSIVSRTQSHSRALTLK